MVDTKELFDDGQDVKGGGRLPPWIRVRVSCGGGRSEVGHILDRYRLNTVCQSARCPNLGQCWHRRTATFMIMGSQCTRNCRFCAVDFRAEPLPLENDEPDRLAAAAKEMGLRYVVVTSVTRDDLADGGATHFAKVIKALRQTAAEMKIEVLTPDFQNSLDSIRTVVEAGPSVFNHNVETVERLAASVRTRARYASSLKVLETAVKLARGRMPVKSGLMVGLGETDEEVSKTIRDIRSTGAEILTVGQYLPPTAEHWPLDRYVHPDKFAAWERLARGLGFKLVAAAPLVRSSYHADELFEKGFVN